MIPRVVRMIFERIESRATVGGTGGGGGAGPENLLRVSFLEIYNEELKDLLHPAVEDPGISCSLVSFAALGSRTAA